jgi:serine phosphatase RsbU (regulator of sigma subunit)
MKRNLLRTFGWLLIIAGLLGIMAIILFNELLPKPVIIVSAFVCSTIIPVGASLVAFSVNDQKRKRLKRIYLYVAIFFGLLFYVSKTFHVPAASLEVIIAVLWYCFAFAPIELKDKYQKWQPYSNSKWDTLLLSTVDFIGLNMLLLGVLFKLMWWPFANALMTGGGIVTLLGLFFWNRKFKNEVVRRKEAEDKIKDQFHEIQDSIKYAKRIQSAILPPQKLVKEYLPESFVLYKPKDIVAGDFYWMEHMDDSILFAAADCTGHGVPGAMVSVVCNNGLNRSVREYGLTEPGKILDKTREIILQEFEKSEEEVKDGMDISLCALNVKERKLEWSGANNPLWIVRKDAQEIEEIKANKQPIGRYAEPKPFTTHQINLSAGDTVYVFTDGYQDQFGGDKGKKFKAAKFKELLLQIQTLSLEEQRKKIDAAFESWRGQLEQVDDVCVIGVRV